MTAIWKLRVKTMLWRFVADVVGTINKAKGTKTMKKTIRYTKAVGDTIRVRLPDGKSLSVTISGARNDVAELVFTFTDPRETKNLVTRQWTDYGLVVDRKGELRC